MGVNMTHTDPGQGGPGAQLCVVPGMFDSFYTAMRNLLANLKEKRPEQNGSCSVVFSSCNRGDGASTVALNFALAFAENSMQRVVLVDGNLRNPVLHEHFGVSRERGVADLIHDEVRLRDALIELKPSRLSLVTAGQPVEKPIVEFESAGFAALLVGLRSNFDLIVFDSSPMIRYPETNVLASQLDGLAMVLQAESTKWEVAQAAKDGLERTGASILGAILNKKQFFIPEKIYRLV
jgi:capsular exopolysaccharide synthesis family protein